MAPRSHFKQKKQAARIAPPPVSAAQRWKDKLITAAWLGLPVVAVVLLVTGVLRAQWQRSIDSRLSAWKHSYQLNDATVEQLKDIELKFHGSGNPFTTPIRHAPEEVRLHHEQIAEKMNSGQRLKFLKDLEEGRLRE